MRRIPFVIATGGVALVLGGCDPLYGVMRATPLFAPPELACVQRAIELTDGVATVTYRARHEGKGLFHPTPWVYDYIYSGPGGVWGSLQLIKTYDGRFSYRNSYLTLHQPPPQSSIDATRPVMRAIEKNIASRCGITELTAGVRENCTGVTCNPLPN
jgi:hypothetical protein